MAKTKRITIYLIILFLLFLLVGIRFYEKVFFDDGLIVFFQYDYLTKALPHIPFIKTVSIDILRYIFNSTISISILTLFFRQKNLGKFLLAFYLIALTINIIAFYFAWVNYTAPHYIALFYIRRILIQPIWLFVLFPALLYQKFTTK